MKNIISNTTNTITFYSNQVEYFESDYTLKLTNKFNSEIITIPITLIENNQNYIQFEFELEDIELGSYSGVVIVDDNEIYTEAFTVIGD